MVEESKLEALRRRKEERELAREKDLESLEVEALELEEKYEGEGKRRGVDYDVATFLIGNFVVRNPDFLLAKRFSDAESTSVEDVISFVVPHILFPAPEKARPVFQEHAGVAWRLAAVMMKLYEADAKVKRGK